MVACGLGDGRMVTLARSHACPGVVAASNARLMVRRVRELTVWLFNSHARAGGARSLRVYLPWFLAGMLCFACFSTSP